jgi:TetR/AcrR family transcriptional regulator, transcriptional repressor for nem operon
MSTRATSERKANSHARIVAVASRLFRRFGYRGTGVDTLMAEAGLTRGGFYAHFQDKSTLLVETLRHIFADSRANLLARGLEDERGRAWVEAAALRYASWKHRMRSEDGCAVPTLGPELARAPRAVRQAFAEEIEALVTGIAGRLETECVGPDDARERAEVLLATWIGAMVLARAIPDREHAEPFLTAVRNASVRIAAPEE